MSKKPSRFKQFFVVDPIKIMSRFPFAMGAAIATTIIGLVLTFDKPYSVDPLLKDPDMWFTYALAGVLLYFWAVAIQIAAEGAGKIKSSVTTMGYQALALIPAAWLVYVSQSVGHEDEVRWPLMLMLSLAGIMFGFAASVITKSEPKTLWKFFFDTVLSIVLVVISMVTLALLLAAAIASIENLFDVNISGDWYETIFVTLFLGIGPLLFLAHVLAPAQIRALEAAKRFTAVTKFTRYVIVPSIVVYFGIIYAYVVKILLAGELPQGEVGYPIAIYTAAIIAFVVVGDPVYRGMVSKAKMWLYRGLWASVLPVMALYIVAMYQRIAQYGITEARYLGVLYFIWMVCVALYFVFSKARQLRVLPVTFAAALLIASLPMIGAKDTAMRSQTAILEDFAQMEELGASQARQFRSASRFLERRGVDLSEEYAELDLDHESAPVVRKFWLHADSGGGNLNFVDVAEYEYVTVMGKAHEKISVLTSDDGLLEVKLWNESVTVRYDGKAVAFTAQELADEIAAVSEYQYGYSSSVQYTVSDVVKLEKDGIAVLFAITDSSFLGERADDNDAKYNTISSFNGVLAVDVK